MLSWLRDPKSTSIKQQIKRKPRLRDLGFLFFMTSTKIYPERSLIAQFPIFNFSLL